MRHFKRLPADILQDVKRAIREPYAWPGGYPLYIVLADGEALSIDAARAEFRQVARATIAQDCSSWQAMGTEINWEDPSLYCAHSGDRIESAYAEDDAVENGGTGELTT